MKTRFIVDYDTSIDKELKNYLIENLNPSMYSDDSVQYCLVDVLDFIKESNKISEFYTDYNYLNEISSKEKVDYIEITF